MKVLIACEFSGIVRDAFTAAGHEAISCDIIPTESPGPHHLGDVREILYNGFDLMIGHPPCQYLSYAGLRHWHAPGRAELRQTALDFFTELYRAPIHYICLENPKGWVGQAFRAADQYINPYQFGQPVRKHTGLWLKNLPKLVPTDIVPIPPPVYTQTTGVMHRGKLKARHHIDSITSKKERSRFFTGIAAAMATQWGSLPANPKAYTQSQLFT